MKCCCVIICISKTLFKQAPGFNKMGRGRKGVMNQGGKTHQSRGLLPKGEIAHFRVGPKQPKKQTILDIPDEVLNELRQMNPRDVANILVNS